MNHHRSISDAVGIYQINEIIKISQRQTVSGRLLLLLETLNPCDFAAAAAAAAILTLTTMQVMAVMVCMKLKCVETSQNSSCCLCLQCEFTLVSVKQH